MVWWISRQYRDNRMTTEDVRIALEERVASGEPFEEPPQPTEEDPSPAPAQAHIPISPPTSRLIVFGSAEFVDDLVFSVSSQLSRDRYVNSLKLAQNAVAWSTEDLDLLDIRARGTFSRVLAPLSREQQSFWETLNYGLALASLIALGYVWSARRTREEPLELIPAASAKPLSDEL